MPYPSSPVLTSNSLEHVAADVVRPSSYELARAVPAWEPPRITPGERRMEWARVWGSVADIDLVDPWGPAVVTLAAAPPSMLVLGLWPGLLIHLLMAIAIPLGLVGVRRVAGKTARRCSTPVRLAVAHAILALGCVPAGAIAVAFPGRSSSLSEGLWLTGCRPFVVS